MDIQAIGQIKEFKQLLDEGILTQEEFNIEKAKLMGTYVEPKQEEANNEPEEPQVVKEYRELEEQGVPTQEESLIELDKPESPRGEMYDTNEGNVASKQKKTSNETKVEAPVLKTEEDSGTTKALIVFGLFMLLIIGIIVFVSNNNKDSYSSSTNSTYNYLENLNETSIESDGNEDIISETPVQDDKGGIEDCNGFFSQKQNPGEELEYDEVSFELKYSNGEITATDAFVYRLCDADFMTGTYSNGVLTLTDNSSEGKHLKFVLNHVSKGVFSGYYEYDDWDVNTNKPIPGGFRHNVTLKRY